VDGVLVVDKPEGPTSHDIVDRVRRALGERRVGHTGTLDPFATGVLPLCLGKATRLARFLVEGEKAYRASVRLGFATNTDDRTGEPLGEPRPVTTLRRAAVEEALAALVGTFDQVPPAFSAKRVGGRRLYELARRGEAVPRQAAQVTVHAIDLIAFEGDRLEIEVRCSAGTYVRALARDLGERLGVGGHLTGLRRTRSGPFDLAQAVPADDLTDAPRRLVPLDALLPELPAVRIPAASRRLVRDGRDLGPDEVAEGFPRAGVERVRLVDEGGSLLALAVPRGIGEGASGLPQLPFLHPEVVLVD
jgi:tRNA pseudouridine55 synthase